MPPISDVIFCGSCCCVSGYMAPEYATRGCLTRKADVYSYGVVALEIVSGMSNINSMSNEEYLHLLDWVCHFLLFFFSFMTQFPRLTH